MCKDICLECNNSVKKKNQLCTACIFEYKLSKFGAGCVGDLLSDKRSASVCLYKYLWYMFVFLVRPSL